MKQLLLSLLTTLALAGYSFAQSPLPIQTSSIFSGSGNCATCHTGTATVLSENGVDISPVTHWRSSMMANSSKDPFWRAVVAEEIHEHPQFQSVIENTCTRCHAPAGHRQSIQNGDSSYTLAQMKQDPLANDGVSCTVCHQFKNSNYGLPSSYSGGYNITTEKIIYGPYTNPLTNPMIVNSGYTPVFSASVNNSELCATCHTLFTPTIAYNGQVAGSFAEQTPYIEWKNSRYQNEGVQCQSCHMPVTNTPIDIASFPPFNTTLRTPYWKHLFAGGNKMMNRMIRNNITPLGITASAAHFDTTLAYTENMLGKNSVNLSLDLSFSPGFLNVALTIQNLAGHKIPTGIPYRRMWIHLTVKDQLNNIVFESGNWDANGEIAGLDSVYEPHYDTIHAPDQVQIYETILKDVNGVVTRNLLRSAGYQKDNRIPPQGFSSSHPSYDTVAIFGNAASDSNFNRDGESQGTGSDIVFYKIPASGDGHYSVTAEICYQPFSPRLTDYLQGIDEPDIQQFISLYATSDKSPAIMRSITSPIVTGAPQDESGIPGGYMLNQNYPNPFNPSTIISYGIPEVSNVTLKLFDMTGNEVATLINREHQPGSYNYQLSIIN